MPDHSFTLEESSMSLGEWDQDYDLAVQAMDT